jgi:polar amino acid transport system ATP-binding protein/sulfate transport system ATP-binding protein
LSGLLQPTTGKVLLGEKQLPVQAGQVGVVFQSYPLMNHRTIIDNLMLAAKNAGKHKDEVMSLLTMFDLQDKLDMYPTQLSGGQRQRVSIIQQFLCSDHFVLMDEPFSGLDVVSKQKMIDLIRKISTSHELSTMIITTHDVGTAVEIADTIWVMGREKDANGNFIPGAKIVKTFDLIGRDLAWHTNIRKMPNFRPTCEEIYTLFNSI